MEQEPLLPPGPLREGGVHLQEAGGRRQPREGLQGDIGNVTEIYRGIEMAFRTYSIHL